MKLSDLITVFMNQQRPVGLLLDEDQVSAVAIAATRFYAGFGHLDSPSVDTSPSPEPYVPPSSWLDMFAGEVAVIDPLQNATAQRLVPMPTALPLPPISLASITQSTEVTASDWALIAPLFLLYVEREQAILLESGRVMGVDVFGRSSSEVQMDINQYETELPQKAFVQPAFTV